MMIRALILDFDGTILDTETPDFLSWEEIFREHGCDLPMSVWAQNIGTCPPVVNEAAYLEELVGRPIDLEAIRSRRRVRYHQMVSEQADLPGVRDLLRQAKARGLRSAVASSSTRGWVAGHLDRLNLTGYFNCLRTSEDVSRTKPDPELFLSALAGLGVEPREAMVFEDSPNGIRAAKSAGIYCLAVPNSITRQLDLSGADLVLESLAGQPLESLLALAEDGQQ
jgi:HAD superfamily hydrolase (TIGR01509 family)